MKNNLKTGYKKTKRICEICGNDFFATYAKTCSKKCSSKLSQKRALETGKYRHDCKYCGEEFKRYRKKNSQGEFHKFCSKACSNNSAAEKRLLTPVIDRNGYVLIGCRNHPNAHQGRVREHRLVMEGILGRYLDKSEIVHHIDGDRQNNDPSNLMVTDHQNHSSCTSKHRERYRVSEAFIKSIGKWEDYLRYVSK